jgi:hypothetical protein
MSGAISLLKVTGSPAPGIAKRAIANQLVIDLQISSGCCSLVPVETSMKSAARACQDSKSHDPGAILSSLRRVLLIGCIIIVSKTPGVELPCQNCHPQESRSQPSTPMAHALNRASESEILKTHPRLVFRDGGYAYEIRYNANQVIYSVEAKEGTFSVPLLWAFGLGSAGQTFVYEYSGALYESRVSFYKAVDGLDITVGHRNIPPANDLPNAAGRRLQKLETSRCFSCHATANGGEVEPGVQCERCHQDAKRHASAVISGASKFMPPKLSQLDSDETSSFCGECHRTWEEIAANGPHDVNNVRFQPYRLAASKCYESSSPDNRIRCTACHDPHKEVVRDTAFYDTKCGSCHLKGSARSAAKTCPVGQRNCASCHMPKVELVDAHFQFTDHRIRVPRQNEPYPK